MLSHQADGALVVVTLGKTTYDLLDKALGTLQKARGRALGIVLNKAPTRGADATTYSYEYRRDYTSPATEVTPVTESSESGEVETPVNDEQLVPQPTSSHRGGRRG